MALVRAPDSSRGRSFRGAGPPPRPGSSFGLQELQEELPVAVDEITGGFAELPVRLPRTAATDKQHLLEELERRRYQHGIRHSLGGPTNSSHHEQALQQLGGKRDDSVGVMGSPQPGNSRTSEQATPESEAENQQLQAAPLPHSSNAFNQR